jgi:S-adenosylmethionine synthetase
VEQVFDLRPRSIIKHLELQKPKYRATAAYGHFGREEEGFSWEKLDKVEDIRKLM